VNVQHGNMNQMVWALGLITNIKHSFDFLRCCRYTGAEGVYTHTVAYERDAACLECSPAAPLEVPHDATLQQVGAPVPFAE
jgi:hypothetical protein